MFKLFELLENVLLDIEKDIKEDINAGILAKRYDISEGYLRQIFKFAFNESISGYIRSRKLAASINDLLRTENNLISIALDYGFEYEQSYLRSFKREFGITPGDLRKSGHIVKVKPPLYLFNENKMGDGLLFGPDIVIVPQFHVIGKRYRVPKSDYYSVDCPKVAKEFWENERNQITNAVNPNVYIGVTRNFIGQKETYEYLPSIQVDSIKNVPDGFFADSLDTSLYARFRYIGQHHYYDINHNIVGEMYKAIINFDKDEKIRYSLAIDKVVFEKIDTGLYDGVYCQMEWFSPVIEKI